MTEKKAFGPEELFKLRELVQNCIDVADVPDGADDRMRAIAVYAASLALTRHVLENSDEIARLLEKGREAEGLERLDDQDIRTRLRVTQARLDEFQGALAASNLALWRMRKETGEI